MTPRDHHSSGSIQSRRRPSAWLRLVLLAMLAPPAGAGRAAEPPPALALVPQPIYRVGVADGAERLASQAPAPPGGSDRSVAFHAILASDWPEGLVPIFPLEPDGRFRLARMIPAGQQNLVEPFFFVLPLEDEPATARVAGRWQCRATHADGARDFFAWELTAQGVRMAGRFDQQTDYRFAHLAGGTFWSNRIELNVEYVQNRYTVTGLWQDGRMSGEWRHVGEADHGTWEAIRPSPARNVAPGWKAVPLYEWRRDTATRYVAAPELNEPGWERVHPPLGRVWVKP